MKITIRNRYFAAMALSLALSACKAPQATVVKDSVKSSLPDSFGQNTPQDSTQNSGITPWREFFTDPNLVSLIEEALHNNQDLLIALQEIEIAKSDVMAKKGNLLPAVGYNAAVGVSKAGRYTSEGAGDATTEIKPGKSMPDPLMDYQAGLTLDWEVDIWNKLRTEKKAAVTRYLSTVEGKNFVLSSLIAEVASKYYELLSLDNQLDITEKYIKLQERALEISKIQKQAAAATELAVKQFEAELAKSKASQFSIRQSIVEKESEINTLLGRYTQPIRRDKESFLNVVPKTVYTGIPSQLLQNRPDIKQAELQLEAAKLDVKAARKEFYPSLNISASLGLDAFKPSYLVTMPEALAYNLTAGLAGPLINKAAIQAQFKQADARQVEALYEYDKTILQAYIDISNQLSKIKNTDEYYKLKFEQSDALDKSIDISTQLFRNARADYLDVLTSQRDALDAKMELIEAKKDQLNTVVNIYKGLGGGWK
jgi:NodT family efflux transporter outer membrane factor (OMF) lipoprotein